MQSNKKGRIKIQPDKIQYPMRYKSTKRKRARIKIQPRKMLPISHPGITNNKPGQKG